MVLGCWCSVGAVSRLIYKFYFSWTWGWDVRVRGGCSSFGGWSNGGVRAGWVSHRLWVEVPNALFALLRARWLKKKCGKPRGKQNGFLPSRMGIQLKVTNRGALLSFPLIGGFVGAVSHKNQGSNPNPSH